MADVSARLREDVRWDRPDTGPVDAGVRRVGYIPITCGRAAARGPPTHAVVLSLAPDKYSPMRMYGVLSRKGPRGPEVPPERSAPAVVLRCRDRAGRRDRALGGVLGDVLAQTFTDRRLVVVDDGGGPVPVDGLLDVVRAQPRQIERLEQVVRGRGFTALWRLWQSVRGG